MLISEFSQYVADFMNRDVALFDVASTSRVDKVRQAANNAKLLAQRRIDFELAKGYGQLTISSTGGSLSSVYDIGGITPCRFKTIKRAFVQSGTDWVETRVISLESFLTKVQNEETEGQSYLVRSGDLLELFPTPTTPVVVRLWGFKFLREYGAILTGVVTTTATGALKASAGNFVSLGAAAGNLAKNTTTGVNGLVTGVTSATELAVPGVLFTATNAYEISSGVQSDFFLTDCVDWMLYSCVQELNTYLKEDQRMVISKSLLDTAWQSVLGWNVQLSQTEGDL